MLTQDQPARLNYAMFGNPSDPAVLLIAGLQQQRIDWPSDLVSTLSDAGFYVICFDNRDVGESEHFTRLGTPNIVWQVIKARFGLSIKAAYSIQDMADDAIALLNTLQIKQAHLIGWSMGGMIAQRVCLSIPTRTLSLTCIMSSSGPPATPHNVLKKIGAKPVSQNLSDRVQHITSIYQFIAGPHYPEPVDQLKQRITVSLQRSDAAQAPVSGGTRQLLAIMADTQRPHDITHITTPTLVIHGKADPLVPFHNGADIATRIPNAKLIAYEKMGHDFAQALRADMSQHIIEHLQHSNASFLSKSKGR